VRCAPGVTKLRLNDSGLRLLIHESDNLNAKTRHAPTS
jgi:hypothetical protein